MLISSLQNSKIKNVVRLNNRYHRDSQQRTLVEGLRECQRALQAGIVPLEAYICADKLQGEEAEEVVSRLQSLDQARTAELFEVTEAVFAKIAYRGDSGGVLLVIPYWEAKPEKMLGAGNPFLVVIDGAEKPGNVGAILRTGDAAGIDGLIISAGKQGGTDIYNPNAIRASLGALFTVPFISLPDTEAISRLKEAGIKIVATSPDAQDAYTGAPLTGPVAIVLGSEAQGLGKNWLAAADQRVRIPMFGVVDSLNLSVSAALVLYEVVRQRQAG